MKVIYKGNEYVLEQLSDGSTRRITLIDRMTHLGSLPGVRIGGWSSAVQVYSNGEKMFAAAVVGASQYTNYLAEMTPVSTIISRMEQLRSLAYEGACNG